MRCCRSVQLSERKVSRRTSYYYTLRRRLLVAYSTRLRRIPFLSRRRLSSISLTLLALGATLTSGLPAFCSRISRNVPDSSGLLAEPTAFPAAWLEGPGSNSEYR